jgi:hypothetical protein
MAGQSGSSVKRELRSPSPIVAGEVNAQRIQALQVSSVKSMACVLGRA